MSTLSAGEKRIKRAMFWDKLTFVLVAIFLALSTLFSVTLIYQKTYFKIKWVNGQSMYPTFNANAKRANGQPKGIDGGPAFGNEKNFDCVIYDPHETTMSKLERFDIVILSKSKAADDDLIKRVLVLPGETFYFGSGEDNGTLYIQGSSGEFAKIEQPIGESYIRDGDYTGYYSPVTLSDNQYFVCGDNRGHSTDSRNFGPIEKSQILGIVVAVIGTCDTKLAEDNSVIYTNMKIGWPRFIK